MLNESFLLVEVGLVVVGLKVVGTSDGPSKIRLQNKNIASMSIYLEELVRERL